MGINKKGQSMIIPKVDKTRSKKSRWMISTLMLIMLAAGNNMAWAKVNMAMNKPGEQGKVKVYPFDLSQVRLLDSPFKHAMVMDGYYMMQLDPDRLLSAYRKNAGLKPKGKQYKGWETSELQGHTLGHYMSALSMIYAATGEKKFLDRLNYIVDELQQCQQAGGDGYIGGIPDGQKLWDKVKSGEIKTEPFSLDGVWSPWYNLHKVYAGLRDAYWYTGNEQAKDVLVKYADWAVELSNHLTDDQFQHMLECEYGGMNEVMADIYQLTGKEKYLDLAERFNQKKFFAPLAQSEDNLTGLHSNTQIPKIIGAAREYELTGNERMEQIAKYFWKDVAQNRSYIIGGNSLGEHFGPMGQLHKRIGKNTAETCNTYNMLKLTRHLMQWQPDNAAYADFYERALYNDILASQDPETGMMTYFMSLEPGFFKTFSEPYDSFWCCVGTGMENHVKYGKNIFQHNDSNLYLNLFIPAKLNWKSKGVEITQETDFPESGQTMLKISADLPSEFTLHIRRPYWAGEGFSVKVNGKTVNSSGKPRSFVEVQRTWKDGDVVQVSLPMKLHVEPMPDDNKKVAVMYGPLVLAGKLGGPEMFVQLPYASDQYAFFSKPKVMVPDFAIANKPVTSWLKPVSGKPLHFKTKGVGRPVDVEMAPFYEVNHQPYSIYWNVVAD